MTRTLQRFLASGDTLSRLHDHASRLRRLQGVMARLLPPSLAGACVVANIKQDTLVILARSGAAASKLRQMAPSLVLGLASDGIGINKIQVKVQVHEDAPPPPPAQPRVLTEEGCKSIEALCESLPADAPLRRSLEKLLASSKRR